MLNILYQQYFVLETEREKKEKKMRRKYFQMKISTADLIMKTCYNNIINFKDVKHTFALNHLRHGKEKREEEDAS